MTRISTHTPDASALMHGQWHPQTWDLRLINAPACWAMYCVSRFPQRLSMASSLEGGTSVCCHWGVHNTSVHGMVTYVLQWALVYTLVQYSWAPVDILNYKEKALALQKALMLRETVCKESTWWKLCMWTEAGLATGLSQNFYRWRRCVKTTWTASHTNQLNVQERCADVHEGPTCPEKGQI